MHTAKIVSLLCVAPFLLSAGYGSVIDPIFAFGPPGPQPGCAVGVFRGGEIAFAKGYGFASLEHSVPITPTTTFEIGSMSKQFTATAILLLLQDGKLALDDDVRKYIPELPRYGRTITLRHLLHHTGGLREYDELLNLSGWDPADVATEAEALHLVTLQKGVNFPAGTEWSYSNTGYFLLSIVVKRVSGQTLAAFSKARIFDPLGMKDTSILDDHTKLIARRATGYTPQDKTFGVNLSNREMTGEGNIQSTIVDLARWDANFYQPNVGGAAWLQAMRTPGRLDDGTPLTYAMGLMLKTVNGIAEEEHSGGWAGYLADWRRYPKERVSVVCLCNRDDVNPLALTQAVAATMLPALLATAPSVAPTTRAPASDVAALAGAYLEPEGLVVRTFAVDKQGALAIGVSLKGEGPPRPLEPIDARTFRMHGAESRWIFAGAGTAAMRVTRSAPGEKARTFERFVPVKLTAAELVSYVGRYQSEETTHDFEVAVLDGKLSSGPWGKAHMATQLEPLRRDRFTAPEYGLVFGRDAKGRITTLTTVFDGHHAMEWTKR